MMKKSQKAINLKAMVGEADRRYQEKKPKKYSRVNEVKVLLTEDEINFSKQHILNPLKIAKFEC